MATTLKIRAGSSSTTQIKYKDSEGAPVDTSGYVARFQIRAVTSQSRVLLDEEEYVGDLPAPVGTVLTRTDTGEWTVFLGKSVTNSLPPTSIWEFELVSSTNPEDVNTLATGTFKVTPEAVI